MNQWDPGRSKPSRGSFSIWKALILGALVIELIVIVVLISDRPEVVPTERPIRASSDKAQRFEDPEVPYSFAYPKGWQLENDDMVTKLVSPGNNIAIAVGPAPSGDVLVLSDRLVEGITERYADARTKSRKLVSVGGNLGLTVSGTAINRFGVRVRFAIVTIEGTEGSNNYAITSFAAADVEDPERALQEVVDDFAIQ